MTSLIEVRNLLTVQGRMEAKQIGALLNAPQPLINAMLARLEAMGKAQRNPEDPGACLNGSCKQCPQGKACQTEWWSAR
ncbi:[Fe-S]-dependent transcriptional repressor FeoC [Entomohabitans teleogrylli]|uniref:[Fe-S]-dependent transcriptional repressor FeoC n=1 Tax=Entomohabitans teleogrylli TaxID=1384589 RepID=UPI00073D325A|nr:[Fe-S]-dependent transcriptional repressor FeoC [Entomohabitans teleogrylli]